MAKKKQYNAFAHPTDYKTPRLPDGRKICPGCLDPMPVWYAWWSSERVCHIMLKCECGTKAKVKLVHVLVDKKGNVK